MNVTQSIPRSLGCGLRRQARQIKNVVWLDLHFRKLGLGHAKRIHTYTTQNELEALYQLAAACPTEARVAEIGAYVGASSCYLAAGLLRCRGHLYCVDTWQNETMPDGTRDTFSEFLKNTAPVAKVITTIRKRNVDLSEGDLPNNLMLAFVDGDHSYEAVRNDVALLAPKIAPDGVLAFHDAICFVGVSRTIGELLCTGQWKLNGQVENLVWLKKQGFSK